MPAFQLPAAPTADRPNRACAIQLEVAAVVASCYLSSAYHDSRSSDYKMLSGMVSIVLVARDHFIAMA